MLWLSPSLRRDLLSKGSAYRAAFGTGHPWHARIFEPLATTSTRPSLSTSWTVDECVAWFNAMQANCSAAEGHRDTHFDATALPGEAEKRTWNMGADTFPASTSPAYPQSVLTQTGTKSNGLPIYTWANVKVAKNN